MRVSRATGRRRRAGAVAATLLAALLAGPAFAQAPRAPDGTVAPAPPPAAPAEDRMRRMEDRLNELERKHQEDLRARDAEIARLRTELERRPVTAPAPNTGPASPANPAPAAPAGGAPGGRPPPSDDEIERTRQDILGDIDRRRAGPLALRKSADFNPSIAVIADFVANYSSNRNNDALNRLDVRELELDMRAAVDPRADAVAVLAFERDVENPVFPGGEPTEGPGTTVNMEEAYLYLHDFGVPNLTAKLGRFNVRFGRLNVLHLHDLPTTDPPLVNQAFLSPEALTDGGLSLSYFLPPQWTGGEAVEVVAEVLSGEGTSAESPTLTGDANVDSPAVNVHALWNTNLSPTWNLELGGSFLTGTRGPDNGARVYLYGVDATFVRRDPTGRFNNSLVQGEFIYGDVGQEAGPSQRAWGAYLLGQQQLNRDLFLGLRLDYTQDPNADDFEAYGFTPYVSWWWSEFLRFRLQYQHKRGDVPTENNVYLQATWIFGAHPPHPYWSMR